MTAIEKENGLNLAPLDQIQQILRTWWLFLVCSLVGGGLAYGFSFLIPARYESRFIIAVTLDPRITGVLSDVELDQVLTSAGDIITSSDVMTNVLSNATTFGINIHPQEIPKVFYRERQFNHWILRVLHENPQAGQQLAEIWMEEAAAQLDLALFHAERASVYDKRSQEMIGCSQQVIMKPILPYCNLVNLDQILNQIDNYSSKLIEERKGSRGLLSGMSYAVIEQPVEASKPRRNNQGWMILAGSGVGLISALIFLMYCPNHFILRKKTGE